MKKFLRSMMCLIAAASVCSLCGCTVSKTAGKNSDAGLIKPDAESAENNTVVYSYEYTNPKGKKEKQEVDIDVDEVDKIEFVSSGDLKNEKFVSKYAENYGMSEKEAKKAVSEKSEYKEFRFVEYIENKSDKRMAFKQIKVEENGKNNIWINTSFGAEYTIVPGAIYPIYVTGVADMSKQDEDAVNKIFKEMKVQLEYTLVDNAQDDIDWENSDIRVLDIH